MCISNKLVGCSALISALIAGQQVFSQTVIPDDKCAIITGATKDPKLALKAVEMFKEFAPVVIESNNGYLAPSLGIYYKDGAKELVEQFKRDKIIPDDAYCGNAERFVSVLYPNQNFTALTSDPPSLISQYGYVGKWSAEPSDCNVTEYETNSIYFEENTVNFATRSCDIKDIKESSVNPLYLNIELYCFEEGEEYEQEITVTLPLGDTVELVDTGEYFTKCLQ